ncbi:hypothetical protein ACFWYW_24035 [Nonomuraea sp. NPDC059023]|uniref:hypothetical protein n=1 Tax=unclassified Nonomuraea TaxID=2593643 RepID=UPI0036ABED8B
MTILNPDGSLKDPFRNYIALSRYSRWLEEERRRETWGETVDRYLTFMTGHLKRSHGYVPDSDLLLEIREAIREHQVFPSMRALMTAGPALHESSIGAYNCAYLPINDIKAFAEVLFILMHGTGVGFSCEHAEINQLPAVPPLHRTMDGVEIVVPDNKLGWATSFETLLTLMWRDGVIPTWNLSAVRPKGARLRTFGGRASGPEPLNELFSYTVNLLSTAQGRKLTALEVHDLVCKIASVVQAGGVRRSALISLSDLADRPMALAKSGEWWNAAGQRAFANNSAVYAEPISKADFDREWADLVASGSGERGIFNRSAARRQASRWGRRDAHTAYGGNPCMEILLRPHEFCNLSSVVARPGDDASRLRRKVELAAILGTWQSTLVNFPYLRADWRANCEAERLLGVSLNGIFGNELLREQGPDLADLLDSLRAAARQTNEHLAAELGINPAAAITCVKPEGNSSQLAGVSSALHPWYAPTGYIRTVRADTKDPLAQLMLDAGVPCESDLAQPDTGLVFSFPIDVPADAVTREDLTALEHLELWLTYKRHWCEHTPSVTVSVRDHEWPDVGAWVWDYLDDITGVSFLPHSDHVYQQAPYQPITAEGLAAAKAAMPSIRWADLVFYETEDHTEGAREFACVSGACDTL